MKYSTQIQPTATPVDIVEVANGLTFITRFTDLTPYTLIALLQGYGCSSDMLKRTENNASIFNYATSSLDFFVTSNIHTFAACSTNKTKSIRNEKGQEFVQQTEIIDLIESFEGSFERSGTYIDMSKITLSQGMEKISFTYTPPVFETAMRYLVFLKESLYLEEIHKERFLLVLYIPKQSRRR